MVLGNKFCTNPFKNCFSWCPKITIVLCTVVCLVAKPLNRNESCYDTEFAAFQVQITLLSMLASTIARSASLQIKGLEIKYATVKWPIGDDALVA